MSAQLERLRLLLQPLCRQGLCLAFSGGVDSTVVLAAAVSIPTEKPVQAVLFATQLHPPAEEKEAEKLCREMGTTLTVLRVDEFSDPCILQNPVDRCYHCKKLLFTTLRRHAQELAYPHCADGTNADDLLQYRPGLKALSELSIISPLAQCGFSKAQVRALASELGLSVQAKPSSPCLATRLPYNTPITRQALSQIARGEAGLQSLGFAGCRVRLHGNIARVEIPLIDFPRFLQQRKAVVSMMKGIGFAYVTLDLEGFRSGSMDEPLGLKKQAGSGEETERT